MSITPQQPAAAAYTDGLTTVEPVTVANPRSPLVMGVVAALLAVAAIANLTLSSAFPSNAPVESLLNQGTSLTLLLGAVALAITAICVKVIKRGPAPLAAWDPLAITGVVLTGVAFLVWLTLGGGLFVFSLATGNSLRYMNDVNGIFWAGFPWVLGMIFGALGYRLGAGRANLLAYTAVGVGLLLIVPTIASAAIYALDLSA
ncbi:MAG: hypothetical protein ACOH1T_03150 [Microbacteriaceae bacterium]